ncbi:MAG: copper homeostasis protein CutC [Candidatus Nanopelagicales bacterium]
MIHSTHVIEVLATSIGAVRLALLGGADRIELCDNDPQGGTTPSAGTIETALILAEPSGTPLHVMIRPRGGGFVFDRDEHAVMRRDLRAAVHLGVDGVVLGMLIADGQVDRRLLEEFIETAQGRSVTFHRAIDVAADLEVAVETAFDLGCDRVLTSGGAPTAVQGAQMIARLVRNVRPGRVVLAGGGITADTVAHLVADTLVPEIHVSARGYRTTGASPRPPGLVGVTAGPGPDWPVNGWPAPDVEHLARIRDALVDVAPSGRFGEAD